MPNIIVFSIALLMGASVYVYKWDKSNRRAFRWLSLFIFVSGFGWFNVLYNEYIIPYLTSLSNNASIKNILFLLLSVFSSFTHYMGPFFYLVFSIKYSALFSKKYEKIIIFIFAFSIVILNIIFPINNFKHYHIHSTTFWLISSLWALIIAIISTWLLIYSYINEIPGSVKTEREILCICLVPVSIFVLIANYILFIFKINNAWRISIWYILPCVPFFLYHFVRLSRNKLSKLQYDASVNTINTSVNMFFHEVNKDLNNIHISLTNYVEDNNLDPNSILEFSDIFHCLERLNMFLRNSHSFVHGINVKVGENSLFPLINSAIDSVLVICKDKNISISFQSFDAKILCDSNYIVSVFRNLLLNSVEALDDTTVDGIIDICCKNYKNYISIYFIDNGPGIPDKNIKYIFNPYFTTKAKSQKNHGLGLSYCREVIERHGGSLTIKNNKPRGVKATIFLKKACADK